MNIQALVNPQANDPWIECIGKYILNMGAVEATTRVIIAQLNGTDKIEIYSDHLSARVNYLRARYPNADRTKHQKAMEVFEVLKKHIVFRNIVAHSSVVYADGSGGAKIVVGLMNLKPKDPNNVAEIVSLEELKGRIDESASVGSFLAQISGHFQKDRGRAGKTST